MQVNPLVRTAVLGFCILAECGNLGATDVSVVRRLTSKEIVENPNLDPQKPVDLSERPELRPIVYIFKKRGSGGSSGTGFLISACHVMTNWHVIEGGDKNLRTLSDSDLSAAFNNAKFSVQGDPSGHWPSTRWNNDRISEGTPVAWGARRNETRTDYKDLALSENDAFSYYGDWAVIRLKRRLGDILGWFEVVPVTYARAKTLNLIHAGYPSYRFTINGTQNFPTPHLVAQDNFRLTVWGSEVQGLGFGRLDWRSDSVSGRGQSGSPLLSRGRDGKLRAIAVLWGGVDGADDYFSTTYSPLTLFTPDRLRALQEQFPCE